MKNFTMVGETKKIRKKVVEKPRKKIKRIDIALQSVEDIGKAYKEDLLGFNKEVASWKKFVLRFEAKTKYVTSFTQEEWDKIEIKINDKRKEIYNKVV